MASRREESRGWGLWGRELSSGAVSSVVLTQQHSDAHCLALGAGSGRY